MDVLCSEACAGRAPGTPQGIAAREHLVAAFAAAGVEPAGEQGYLQAVPGCGANVLARIPGRGPLAERAVLVAAHYDHLGRHAEGTFWGADDNAAAVAILLDLARGLAAAPEGLGRQVILAAFDGEEPPHFLDETMGSMRYVRQPTAPLDRLDAMVCMDLCGHAVGPPGAPEPVRRSLFVLGAELSEGTPALCDAVAAGAQGVVPRRLALDVIPPLSDYHAFRQAGVPVLFLTCGRWEHYHQPSDTPDKLDFPKILATADYLRELTLALSARPEAPVRFLPEGRDDAATVASLLALADLLAPYSNAAALARPVLRLLAGAAAKGPLGRLQRGTLHALVAGLEVALA